MRVNLLGRRESITSMARPARRHHLVSKFYLRHFADENDMINTLFLPGDRSIVQKIGNPSVQSNFWWVAVKWRWRLKINGTETTFLTNHLRACGRPSGNKPTRLSIGYASTCGGGSSTGGVAIKAIHFDSPARTPAATAA
jgi:hypothetical protein